MQCDGQAIWQHLCHAKPCCNKRVLGSRVGMFAGGGQLVCTPPRSRQYSHRLKPNQPSAHAMSVSVTLPATVSQYCNGEAPSTKPAGSQARMRSEQRRAASLQPGPATAERYGTAGSAVRPSAASKCQSPLEADHQSRKSSQLARTPRQRESDIAGAGEVDVQGAPVVPLRHVLQVVGGAQQQRPVHGRCSNASSGSCLPEGTC